MCQTGNGYYRSNERKESEMKITRIGLDLAKEVFQVHGVDRAGQAVVRRRLRRGEVLKFFAGLEPCLVGMEACGGAHHWGRELMKLGHQVRLISPQFVKPYVKSNKNDANDAEAICEAVSRPGMRFVAVKTCEQQELQAIHRVRSGLVGERTALGNRIRGLLAEFGVVLPKQLSQLRCGIAQVLEDGSNGLRGSMRGLLDGLRQDLERLDGRVLELNRVIEQAARQDPACQRLSAIEGIGAVSATALVAAVGGGAGFANGRGLSASLGLVPRQHGSGGKAGLGAMSKRGDPYLRCLLIHGARAVLRRAAGKTDRRSRWLQGLIARRHTNVAAVALANKNARIAWALLARGETYAPVP
jgi:transposase